MRIIAGLEIDKLVNELKVPASSAKEIIQIAREVEHEFIGVKGGIMDQFTIINGKDNKLIFYMIASFQKKEMGLEHQENMLAPFLLKN